MPPQSWILVSFLVSTICQHPVDAVSDADIQRVLVAYNPTYDHCRGIGATSSVVTAKASADKTCAEAFEALDRLFYNNCKGWRHAECRLVSPGDQQYQCSCEIPHRKKSKSKNSAVKPFRECAATLLPQELVTGAPVADFQQIGSNYNEVQKWAEIQAAFPPLDQYAGSSDVVYTGGEAGGSLGGGYNTYGAGPSSSAYAPYGVYTTGEAYIPYGVDMTSGYTHYGVDTTAGAYTPYVVDTTSSPYTSYLVDTPSGPYDSYGVDTTPGVFNQQGVGSSDAPALLGTSLYPSTTYPSSTGAAIPGPCVPSTTYISSSGVDAPGPSGYQSTTYTPPSILDIPGPSGHQSATNPSNAPVSQTNRIDPAKGGHALPFSCPTCTMPFKTLLEMGDHMKVHQEGGPVFRQPEPGRHQCRQCGKSYSVKRVLQAHEKSHGTLETYCLFCNQTLASKAGYKSHMERRHTNFSAGSAAGRSGPIAGGPETGRFPCSGCGKTFVHKRALRAHERTHRTLETYCIYCKIKFSSHNGYRDHMQKRHPTMAAAEAEVAKQRREAQKTEWCEICGKGFKKGIGLKEHKRVHDGLTKCPECGGIFSRISALKTHRKTMHNVEDP